MPGLSAAIGRGEEGAWDLRNFMTVMYEGKFVWDANGGPGGAGSVGLRLSACCLRLSACCLRLPACGLRLPACCFRLLFCCLRLSAYGLRLLFCCPVTYITQRE